MFLILFVTWQVLFPFGLNDILAYAIVLAVVVIFFFLDKQSLWSLGLRMVPAWTRYVGIGLVLGILFVTYLFGLGSVLFANAPEYLTRPLITTLNLGLLNVPYVATLALLIAIVEETAFRGYILRNLLSSYSHRMALVYCAILFALYHLSFFYISDSPLPPSQTFTYWSSFELYAFVSGLVLGYFYMNTQRTIIGPVAYHASAIFIQNFVPYTQPFLDASGHLLITIPALAFLPLLVLLKRKGWLKGE